jgi:chromosome segregation ATPase
MTKKEMEQAIGNHADWIEHLAGRMDELAAAQVKTQAQIEETNKSLREFGQATDKRIGDLGQRIADLGQATDKRIGDLVSAIGSLVSQMGGQKGN